MRVPIGIGLEGDALDYRIPLIDWSIRHHAYPQFYWTYVDDYPALGEILMTFFRYFAAWGPRVVGVAGYFLFIFISLRISELFLQKKGALLATLIVSSAHLIIIQDNLVMVDELASAFTLCSCYFLLREFIQKSDRLKPYLYAGVFSGLALATRFTQIPAVAGLSLLAAVLSYEKALKQWAKRLLIFGLPLIAVFSPWLIRNMILNGNPIFPLGVPLLGGAYFEPLRYKEFLGYVANYGFGTSLKEFLVLPWRFARAKSEFDYAVGALPLFLLPWALIPFFISQKKKAEILPAILALVFVTFWFFTSKQARFLLHAYPFFVIAGLVGMNLVSTINTHSRRAISFLFALLFILGGWRTFKHAQKHDLEFYKTTPAPPQLDIVQWLNQHKNDGKALWLERTGNLFLYQGDFIFAFPHPYSTSLYDFRNYGDSQKYYGDLYNEGVRYVYLYHFKQLPPPAGEFELKLSFSGRDGGEIYALKKNR